MTLQLFFVLGGGRGDLISQIPIRDLKSFALSKTNLDVAKPDDVALFDLARFTV